MNIKMIAVGKFKNRFLIGIEEELLKRLKISPFKIEQLELSASKSSPSNLDMAPKLESEKILAQVRESDYLIALDESGKQFSSPALARWLQERMNSGCKTLVFVIGGAYGLDPAVLKRANLVLSLSELTFPFHFARTLLIEQLYRASSIISGTSYHKE